MFLVWFGSWGYALLDGEALKTLAAEHAEAEAECQAQLNKALLKAARIDMPYVF